MKQIFIIFSLCLGLVAGNALALEPLPAPPGGPKLDGITKEDAGGSDEGASAKHEKSKKSSGKTASAKNSKNKDNDQSDDSDQAADQDKEQAADSDADEGKQAKETNKIEGNLEFEGDKRIKMLLYDEADVYTITTRYGYQTNVVFSPQEEIQLISVGDRSLWQIIPAGHRMFIRPLEEDVITNMTVLTNKRSYQFDLKSLPPDKSGNIYVAQFVYKSGGNKKSGSIVNSFMPSAMLPPGQQQAAMPASEQREGQPMMPGQQPMMPASAPFGVGPSIPGSQGQVASAQMPVSTQMPPMQQPAMQQPVMQAQPAAMPPQAMTTMQAQPEQPAPAAQPMLMAQATAPPQAEQPAGGLPMAGPNYSYTYSGPDDLAPLQVYDDGHATYLKYRDIGKLAPSVYIVDPSGKENAVSYSVKGEYMVINAVAGELALRADGSVVHVFNEVLNPG